MERTIILLASAFLATLVIPGARGAKPDPEIAKLVAEVSPDRIAASMEKLAGFGTRGNFSTSTETRGIGAARLWIHDQFAAFSPRLEVTYDTYKVKKQGARMIRDFELVNVVAVLPGTTHPEERLIVSGHYDSTNQSIHKEGVSATLPDGTPTPTPQAPATMPAGPRWSWNWHA